MNLPEAQRVRRFLTVLWAIFALITLNACESGPETLPVVCEKETIEVPVPVYRPLPDELTEPLPYPPGLKSGFTVLEAVDLIYYLYDTVDLANDDRTRADRITRGDNESGDTE